MRLPRPAFLPYLLEDLTAACADTAYQLYQLENTTEDLLLEAIQRYEIAADTAEDIRQAALGNTRTACQWCDGEFFVPADLPGPHTCWHCRPCDGY